MVCVWKTGRPPSGPSCGRLGHSFIRSVETRGGAAREVGGGGGKARTGPALQFDGGSRPRSCSSLLILRRGWVHVKGREKVQQGTCLRVRNGRRFLNHAGGSARRRRGTRHARPRARQRPRSALRRAACGERTPRRELTPCDIVRKRRKSAAGSTPLQIKVAPRPRSHTAPYLFKAMVRDVFVWVVSCRVGVRL